MNATAHFIPMAPSAVAKRDHAGLERRHAEADLQHQRQQEGERAKTKAEDEAADDAREKRRQLEQREIKRRVFGTPRMRKIGRQKAAAAEQIGRASCRERVE